MDALEQAVIGHIREALAAFDTDLMTVREEMDSADALFGAHLMAWSEAFCVLYNQMLKIYRARTPMPTGHCRASHVEIGYSSFQIRTWVPDKVQPPVPTSDELVARFDCLIETAWQKKQASAA